MVERGLSFSSLPRQRLFTGFICFINSNLFGHLYFWNHFEKFKLFFERVKLLSYLEKFKLILCNKCDVTLVFNVHFFLYLTECANVLN